MKRIIRYSIRLLIWIIIVYILWAISTIKPGTQLVWSVVQAMLITIVIFEVIYIVFTWWYCHDTHGFTGDRLVKHFYKNSYSWWIVGIMVLIFTLCNGGNSLVFFAWLATSFCISLIIDMPEKLHMKLQQAMDKPQPAAAHGHGHGHGHGPTVYYNQNAAQVITGWKCNLWQKDDQETISKPAWFIVKVVLWLITIKIVFSIIGYIASLLSKIPTPH